ncbi:MAG: hypothetical protein K6F49_03890 [Saccharofermentans sp.]|nr:hypothetical protein [Saccharofermentans sp.]
MKRIAAAVLLLTMALTGCSGYNEHYSATVLISSEGNNQAYQRFWKFKGTRVLDLNNSDKDKDTLYYTATLDEGSVTVYVDYDGEKRELFTIEGGEEVEDSISGIDFHHVYVIIESDGTCEEGDFEFEIA